MTVLFAQEMRLDEDDIQKTVAGMNSNEISVMLGAVIRGILGGRTVAEAYKRPDAIQHARQALDECDMEAAKGLRILSGILSEKFPIDIEDGLGSGEGE